MFNELNGLKGQIESKDKEIECLKTQIKNLPHSQPVSGPIKLPDLTQRVATVSAGGWMDMLAAAPVQQPEVSIIEAKQPDLFGGFISSI